MEDLKIYNFKQMLSYVISNCELTPSVVHYVMKDVLNEVDALMVEAVNQQAIKKKAEDEPQQEVESQEAKDTE